MALLQSILSQLGVNKTFFLQFALVVIAYIFLSRFLFKPVLNMLVLRSYKVEGLKRSADTMVFEHDRLLKEYRTKWHQYEVKAKKESDEIISEAKSKAESMIEESEERASVYMKNKRLEIEKAAGKLSMELGATSTEVEGLIKTRLFGK